jgi:hypothetical protein
MSARLSTACFLLAALLLARCPAILQAKPPDLPVVKPIVCTPSAPLTDDATMPFVFEMREEAEVHLQAQAAAGRRTLTRCLLFAAHPLLALLPLEELFAEEGDLDSDVTDDSAPPVATGNCPYLHRQEPKHAPLCNMPWSMPEDVLGNLKKLEEAETAYQIAEAYRRQGQFDLASAGYGIVQRLCPGSRYDRMAEARLRQLAAEKHGGWSEETADEGTGTTSGRTRELQEQSGEPEELRQRLRSPINLDVTDMPLVKLLDELRVLTPHGLSITVDQSAIEAAGMNLQRPVTLTMEQVSVERVLDLALRPLGLVYRIKDGAVFITTPAGTGEPVTRRYAVADLFVPDLAPVLEAARRQRLSKKVERAESMDALTRLIVEVIAPQSWSLRGGCGTIAYATASQELVICQTAEVHQQVDELLAALRRLVESERSKGTEEESSPTGGKDQSRAPSQSRGVSDLLEGCQQALHEGHYAHADALARRALALDAEAVEAHPLVYKMHLFDQLRRARRALGQPELQSLEQVQRETRASGLILQIEETGEEQEPPAQHPEETLLFVRPVPAGLFLKESGPDAGAGLGGLARLLLDLLKPGNCVEVELTSEGLRGRFQFDLGSAGLRLTWERDGQSALLIWTYGGSETGADR